MKISNNILIAVLLGIIMMSCKSEKDFLVKIETKHGDMYALLFDETPDHKENFIALAQAGRFDSTHFHRVIKNFMIQGGDVFGKEKLPQDTWPTVKAEIVPGLFHSKGMIAAARMGNNVNPERRSSGSQFYIVQGQIYPDRDALVTDMKLLSEYYYKFIQLESNVALREKYNELYSQQAFDAINKLMLAEKSQLEKFYNINLEKRMSDEQIAAYTTIGGTPHLDGEYTVFGKIIKGLEVVDKIAAEKTAARDEPVEKVYMKVSVEKLTKKKIAKDYAYSYE
jgi:peptidyl-prolyl cis-trans isomerase B (cyclophilin B)